MRRIATVLMVVAGSVVAAGCIVPPDPIDPVDPADCDIERRTIETALEAARAESPERDYPATIEEMIGIWLEPGTIDIEWTYSSTGDTYALLGPC